MTEQFPWEGLAKEVQLHIIDCLEAEDIARMMCTSKATRERASATVLWQDRTVHLPHHLPPYVLPGYAINVRSDGPFETRNNVPLALNELSLEGLEAVHSCLDMLSHHQQLRGLTLRRLTNPLPLELSCLTGCETLNMFLCTELYSLPDVLNCLTKLQDLTLRCCYLTSLPDVLSCLTNLQHLAFSSNWQVTQLPEGVSCLVNLHTLNVHHCTVLTSLPEGVSCLTNLRNLDLSGCERLTSLPEGVSCLTNLRNLDLSGCERLTSLPEGVSCLGDLQILYLNHCYDLTSLPDGLSCLTNMQHLQLRDCVRLTSLPNLQNLALTGCIRLTLAARLSGSVGLRDA